jgi:hypothetical protein
MPQSIPGVMREWKTGQLHSGSSTGPVVKNQKQAVAIALSEQRQQGKRVPSKPPTLRDRLRSLAQR